MVKEISKNVDDVKPPIDEQKRLFKYLAPEKSIEAVFASRPDGARQLAIDTWERLGPLTLKQISENSPEPMAIDQSHGT